MPGKSNHKTSLPCPVCARAPTVVTDSRRSLKDIRRRRKCLACGHRFSTRESVDNVMDNERLNIFNRIARHSDIIQDLIMEFRAEHD